LMRRRKGGTVDDQIEAIAGWESKIAGILLEEGPGSTQASKRESSGDAIIEGVGRKKIGQSCRRLKSKQLPGGRRKEIDFRNKKQKKKKTQKKKKELIHAQWTTGRRDRGRPGIF